MQQSYSKGNPYKWRIDIFCRTLKNKEDKYSVPIKSNGTSLGEKGINNTADEPRVNSKNKQEYAQVQKGKNSQYVEMNNTRTYSFAQPKTNNDCGNKTQNIDEEEDYTEFKPDGNIYDHTEHGVWTDKTGNSDNVYDHAGGKGHGNNVYSHADSGLSEGEKLYDHTNTPTIGIESATYYDHLQMGQAGTGLGSSGKGSDHGNDSIFSDNLYAHTETKTHPVENVILSDENVYDHTT